MPPPGGRGGEHKCTMTISSPNFQSNPQPLPPEEYLKTIAVKSAQRPLVNSQASEEKNQDGRFYNLVVKSTGSGVRLPGFEFWFCPLPFV